MIFFANIFKPLQVIEGITSYEINNPGFMFKLEVSGSGPGMVLDFIRILEIDATVKVLWSILKTMRSKTLSSSVFLSSTI